MVDNFDESVSDGDWRRLGSLLTEFSNTFSKDENDLGWTVIVTHTVDTGDSKPVCQPLRRHPPAHMVAIQEHVSNMLRQGVIQPAKSPWASNLILVKKKDGSFRCCVDYPSSELAYQERCLSAAKVRHVSGCNVWSSLVLDV